MRIFRATMMVFLVCLCFSGIGTAQSVFGSTTLDIDEETGIGTATCETDLDAPAQNFYEALIRCSVVDSDGNKVASGSWLDSGGMNGYAQVVLSFDTIPGRTYSADGEQVVVTIFKSEVEPRLGHSGDFLYYDPYDFGYFEASHEDYKRSHVWIVPVH